MSLNSVHPSYGLQTPSRVAKSGDADGARLLSGNGDGANTVRLSDQGKRMSRLSEQMPPTSDNAQKLLDRLAGDLKQLIPKGALDTRGGVVIEVDADTGEIGVKGSPPAAPAVDALIRSQPEIGRQIRDLAALSRQVAASERGADAQQFDQLAQTAAQIRSVVSDYASRFGDQHESHDFSSIPGGRADGSMEYRRAVARYADISGSPGASAKISMTLKGSNVQIHANGRPWVSSSA